VDYRAVRELFTGLVALALVLGILYLRGQGVDSILELILAGVVVGYLGIDIGLIRRRRRQ